MERALAVVSGRKRSEELIREAGELAAGVGAELVLLNVTREEEFAERSAAVASVPDLDASYTVDNARDGARQVAKRVADDVLADLDLRIEPAGALSDEGEEADEILAAAEAYDCDHVFLAGRKRSPTGKALFGDVAQSVVLNFDGAVTILTE